ncbi:hypothetical protein ACQPW1_36230 [Nocardia sp. CA-128927]|uniref:hypothetical protein n=1 Tax=Nocardia sp. CA-128927 TaxID=3239975 RepID=UPI003D976EF1
MVWFDRLESERAALSAIFGDPGNRHVVEIPIGGREFVDIVASGNGKNAELRVRLVDGTTLEMRLAYLSVVGDCAKETAVQRYDDSSLNVWYSGVGLVVRSLDLSCRADDGDAEEWEAEFENDVRSWIDGGFEGELNYSVYARVALTHR